MLYLAVSLASSRPRYRPCRWMDLKDRFDGKYDFNYKQSFKNSIVIIIASVLGVESSRNGYRGFNSYDLLARMQQYLRLRSSLGKIL